MHTVYAKDNSVNLHNSNECSINQSIKLTIEWTWYAMWYYMPPNPIVTSKRVMNLLTQNDNPR